MATFIQDTRTPITKSIFESDVMKEPEEYLSAGEPYWQVEYDSYKSDSFAIFNYTPKAATEMDIVNGWASKYFTGAATLDEMLQNLNSDLKNQLGNAFD